MNRRARFPARSPRQKNETRFAHAACHHEGLGALFVSSWCCCRSVCSGVEGAGYGTDAGYESCTRAAAFSTGSRVLAAASASVSARTARAAIYPFPIHHMADPHSAPATRRPPFGAGLLPASAFGIGGRPASANPAGEQHTRTLDLQAWQHGSEKAPRALPTSHNTLNHIHRVHQ